MGTCMQAVASLLTDFADMVIPRIAFNASTDGFELYVSDPLVKKTQENSGLDISGFNKTADSAGKDDVGAFPDVMSFAGLAPEIM